MIEPPFKPRQFAWCQFPFMEEPLRPGPEEHVGYVADIRRIDGNPHLTVMSIYTTTTPWEPGVKLPLGIIPVGPTMAQKMKRHQDVGGHLADWGRKGPRWLHTISIGGCHPSWLSPGSRAHYII